MHKLSWLALSMALSGCSQHSTYQRPELAIAPAWQQADSSQLAAQAGPWWREFHDPRLDKLVDAVLAANPAMVAEFRAGKEKAFNALVGQAMKATKGKANPQQVNELLRKKLG